ncbi:MAG: LysR family transcriptional regulator [Pseudomonadota bacterium]
MDWSTVTFDWNQARAFLATAEEGSLSAAAVALGTTQPTLGRQVTAFETALGVVLFERIGKRLVLTPAGETLLAHVDKMRDAALGLSLSAAGHAQAIEGQVRISASDVICAYVLPPIVQRINAIAPKLQIDLLAENTISDLQRREADIAIRHVRPTEPDLIARHLRDTSAQFYAATAYLKRRGTPRSSADLSQHDMVGFGDVPELIAVLAKEGIALTPEQFRAGSRNGVVAWEMVRGGLGISIMADDVARATPDVQRLKIDVEPIRFPIWLAAHRDLRNSKRIRIVFDALATALGSPN